MKAFPILRVSTTAQVKEDGGLDSQLLYLQHWLEQHPDYTIESTLELDGYSAYTSKHRPLIERFVVSLPRNSTIVFSEVSRLARMGQKESLEFLFWIMNQGVSIAFAQTNTILKAQDEIDVMTMQQLSMLFEMSRSESAIKALRINNAFKLRLDRIREGSHFKTNNLSAWLKPNKQTKTYHVSDYDIETIQTAFNKRLQGSSVGDLHKWLVADRKPFGKMKGWTVNYVGKLLRMRQVLGEYQPVSIYQENGTTKRKPNGDPVLDYFPRIITNELFSQVQVTFRNEARGRTSASVINPYRGILKCKGCGGAMALNNSKSQGARLRCEAQRNKSRICTNKSMLFSLADERIQSFLRSFDATAFNSSKRSPDTLQLEIEALNQSIKQTSQALATVGVDVPELVTQIQGLTEKRNQLQHELMLPRDVPISPVDVNRDTNPERYNQSIRDLFKGIYLSPTHTKFVFNDILSQGIPTVTVDHEEHTGEIDSMKLIKDAYEL
ncbi:recombinase-like zinc beta ribbon protein [Vibrio crassostreae]|uniref:recombinase family protein n=1 Tax=Vibrio crassostreae TaxID=246167 RepID=UPI000F516D91|nr:recombinase family protein [Vibrio crassostreae]RPF10733.1 recombinase-like zinc beta ribbon protein [Vibrio crassostreae]